MISAVVYNISAFLCIGKISAASFSVFGHVKTVIVIVSGWVLFDTAPTLRVFLGSLTALSGIILFGFVNQQQHQIKKK